ncbi:MAG: hypothetical protein A3D93_02015 [Acidobacteria bacterium RIFCSPHIGHO2_12_FULL_67_30]|nr:MAG: hypothetical protein A3D93_02015 [Acidobacteria bacterium RIFCSPHIGHO2_12_FULL_67_30]
MDVVVLLGAHHDAVAHVGAQAAVVGVVGGADEGKGAVVAVLVAVDLLPVAHRVSLERVADGGNGLEQLQDGLGLGQPGHQAGLPGQGEEGATVEFIHQGAPL